MKLQRLIMQVYARAAASLVHQLRLRGHYRHAERLARAALRQTESTLGQHDPGITCLLNALGIVYKYTGRFDEAERIYRRAIEVAERRDPISNQVADLYHNLGGLFHSAGRHAQAEPFARQAVELRVRARGAEDPIVAADQAALAPILDALGRPEEAECLLTQAVRLLERAPATDRDIAAALNNLAAIRHQQGDLLEAERLYRRALHMKLRTSGPHHPELTPR